MNRKGFSPLIVIVIIAVVVIVGVAGYFIWKNSTESTPPTTGVIQATSSRITTSSTGSATADLTPTSSEKLFTLPPQQTLADVDDIYFSPDGTQFAYIITASGTQKEIVVNGNTSQAYNDIEYFSFSPDSKSFIYSASSGTCIMVVFNNTDGKCYDGVLASPVFSSNGSKYGYAMATSVGAGHYQHYLIINGDETVFSSSTYVVSHVLFSPDLSRFAYVISTSSDPGAGGSVVLDGTAGPFFNDIENFTFSPDSMHFVYTAINFNQTSTGFAYVLDGQEYQVPDYTDSFTFSESGDHLAYFIDGARSDYVPLGASATSTVVMDGQEFPMQGLPELLTLSSDGSQWAYSSWGNSSTLFLDGKVADSFNNGVGHNITLGGNFSPDGKHFAEIIQDLNSCEVKLDGKEVGSYTFTAGALAGSNCINSITFSQNDTHLAYIVGAWHQGLSVVVDGKQGSTYDAISNLHFSPDGSSIIYNAVLTGKDGKELWLIVQPTS